MKILAFGGLVAASWSQRREHLEILARVLQSFFEVDGRLPIIEVPL